MKRKKSTSPAAKKETTHHEEKKIIFSWVSFRLLILSLFLLAGIVWFAFYAIHTKEVTGSDDREYASIGRNIVNGKGIVRNFIYPVDINFFEKLPVPEFVHPPGYPLVLAGFFKLFGISEFSSLIPSYLSYFLLIILFFFFAKRYLEIKTVFIATVILIFNREILETSLVALSEGVYIVIFFLFFSLFVKANSLKTILISGILLGISHLIRENLYPFIIPLFVYLYFYPNLPRWGKLTFFTIGILAPILPNMVRGFLETGSPFFSYGKFGLMAYTERFPWLNIYREIQNPSLFEFLKGEPSQFLFKYLNNLTTSLEQILTISNPYLLAFFLVGMFYWNVSSELKRIKILFLFLLVSQIFFISLFTFTHRFFIPFLPLMVLFAGQSFLQLSEDFISTVKIDWKKRAHSIAVFIFLIFFITPATYTIFQPGKPEALGFKTPQFGFLIPTGEAKRLNDFLRSELNENQVVWTDLPEILEWEGDRLCGWLPVKIAYLYEIHKKIPVDAILLTSIRTPYKMEEEWKYLLFSEHSLPRYRNVKLYKSGSVFAKLLIRDEKE